MNWLHVSQQPPYQYVVSFERVSTTHSSMLLFLPHLDGLVHHDADERGHHEEPHAGVRRP